MSVFSKSVGKKKRIKEKYLKKKKIFKSINVGDVVWAKMPLSEKELKEIEKSHIIRPYLVVYKDNENIYAYKTSSSNYIKCSNYQTYCIYKDKYGLDSNTNVNISELYKIPIDNLREKYYSLEPEDLSNIQKRIQIQKNRNITVEHNIAKGCYVSKGDVIKKDKKLYYVYKVDKEYMYCNLIKKYTTSEEDMRINIDNEEYFVKFDEEILYGQKEKYKIVDIASQLEKRIIDEKRENYLYKLKNTPRKKSNKATKKNKKSKCGYKTGTKLKVKMGEVVYLFRYKGVNYGVNLKTYKKDPRLIFISPYRRKDITGDMKLSEVFNIVKHLYNKKVMPCEPVKILYDKMKKVL